LIYKKDLPQKLRQICAPRGAVILGIRLARPRSEDGSACWHTSAPVPALPPAPPKESDSTGCTPRQRHVRACDPDPTITIVWGVRGPRDADQFHYVFYLKS
jgi:hypothetical protein